MPMDSAWWGTRQEAVSATESEHLGRMMGFESSYDSSEQIYPIGIFCVRRNWCTDAGYESHTVHVRVLWVQKSENLSGCPW